jgi:hypothetical protein
MRTGLAGQACADTAAGSTAIAVAHEIISAVAPRAKLAGTGPETAGAGLLAHAPRAGVSVTFMV